MKLGIALSFLALTVSVPALAAPVVLDVSAAPYLADSTGVSSATAAVASAVAAAKTLLSRRESNDVTIYFPAGTYYFEPNSSGKHVELRDIKGGTLRVKGDGAGLSTLAFGDLSSVGIRVQGSSSVQIEDLHLTRVGDGASVPDIYTTQGTVESVRPGAVEFRVDAGFPDPTWLAGIARARDELSGEANQITLLRFEGHTLDPHVGNGATKQILSWDLPAVEPSTETDGSFTANLDDTASTGDFEVGDRVALKAKCGEETVRLINCNDCSIRRTRITRMAGEAIRQVGDSNRTIVDEVVVDRGAPIEGMLPMYSGAAGGIILGGGDDVGGGPVISNSRIIGTADDAISIYSSFGDDPARLTSGAQIRNNFVRDNHGRGILILQSKDGVCEDNVVVRSREAGIMLKVLTTSAAVEPVLTSGWVLSNNTLVRNGFGSAIALYPPSSETAFEQMTIVGNTVYNVTGDEPAINLGRTDTAWVADNVFVSFGEGASSGSVPVVRVAMSSGVAGTGNLVLSPTDRRLSDSTDVEVALAETVEITFRSEATVDGYVNEAPESSTSTVLTTGTGRRALRVGDTSANGARKAFVSFDTSALPDDARIVSVELGLTLGDDLSPTGPDTWGGPTLVSIAPETGFSGTKELNAEDSMAATYADSSAGVLVPTSATNTEVSEAILAPWTFPALNVDGTTQFRIEQYIPSNCDATGSFQGYFSGDHRSEQNRPSVTVRYVVAQ